MIRERGLKGLPLLIYAELYQLSPAIKIFGYHDIRVEDWAEFFKVKISEFRNALTDLAIAGLIKTANLNFDLPLIRVTWVKDMIDFKEEEEK